MKTFFFLCFCIVLPNSINAQWSTDPSKNLKVAGGAINPQICTDGQGGCYIAWETGAAPNRRLLRIQRLDRYGYKQFPEQGLQIRLGEFDQANLILFEDGVGGAIVVFNELLPTADTLKAIAYAQRIDSVGTRVWGDSAVVVSPSPAHQIPLAACKDGSGGTFVFWTEDRNANGDDELYGKRIDASGENGLASGDVLIQEANSIGAIVIVVLNEFQEVILTYNSFVQKFNLDLVPIWGKAVNLGVFPSRKMISDGTGGVVLSSKVQSYYDNGPFYKILAQRIDSNGNIVWNEGFVLADSVRDPSNSSINIVKSDSGIYFVIWSEFDNQAGVVKVQSIDNNGAKKWHDNYPISSVISSKAFPELVTTSNNRIIVTWLDYRNGQFDLYGQSIDINQNRLWGETDIAVTLQNGFHSEVVTTTDGKSGVIAAWYEIGVGTGNGVFVQQVSRDGKLGNVIVTVKSTHTESGISSYNLQQSYPNPFNPSTMITYQIPETSFVTLKIYDITGKEVITLVNKRQHKGVFQVTWDGKNEKGGDVSSGLYFYRLQADSFVQTRKAVYIK